MPLTVLDLFAGAGGLTQGFHSDPGKFATVRAIEVDADAARTFNENHGADIARTLPIQEWLLTEDAADVAEQGIDVIVGGPPCQGFSALGKQDSNDERNRLWRHYAETILLTQPKYFVVENVATFLRSSEFLAFRKETQPGGMLEEWDFTEHILNAADFGAPQARKRAVLLGHRRDVTAIPEPTRTHCRPDSDDLLPWVTVRDAFAGSNQERAIPARTGLFSEWPGESGRGRGPFRTDALHVGRNYTSKSLERFAEIPEGGNRFSIPDHLLAPCWRNHQTGSADVMGRLYWDRPSVTIRTEFFKPEKGRYLHPEENRAISHWEAARLQGFPDSYLWYGSRTSIARQIGNAVPVKLSEAISAAIARIDATEPLSA